MSSAAPLPLESPAPPPASGAPPPRRKRRGWFGRIAIRTIRIVLLLLLVVLGVVTALVVWILFFFPNDLAASFAMSTAKSYGVELGIGKLDVRPLHDVTLEGLAIDVPSNARLKLPPLITVKKVHVAWNLHDALDKKAHVTGIEVTEPRIHLEQSPDKWNWERAMADLTANPLQTATPVPVATVSNVPFDQQLQEQSKQVEQLLSSLPLQADVDRIEVRGAGIDVKTPDGTIASLDGAGVDLALHFPKGGGATAKVDVMKEPGILVGVQPNGDTGFSATIHPDVHVAMDLPKKVTFDVDTKVEEGLFVAAGVELPVYVAVKAKGDVDVSQGDVKIAVESLDLDHCVDAKAGLEILALGTKGIHARWNTGIRGDKLPGDLHGQLSRALTATSLHPGAKLSGSLDGQVDSTDIAELQRTFAQGRFPLTLTLVSSGESDESPIEAKGVKVGHLQHRATVKVTHAAVDVDSDATISRIQVPQVLGGTPFSLHLVDRLNVPASLDSFDLGTAKVEIPEHGIRVEGHGRVAGLKAALASWQESAKSAPSPATFASMEKAGLGAVTVLSEIKLFGGFDFDSKKDLEVAPGTTIHGGIHATASLTRGKDPFGRVKADIRYVDFGATVANTSQLAGKTKTAVEKKLAEQKKIVGKAAANLTGHIALAQAAERKASDQPEPEDAPLLLIEGMSAHLTVDRELILGGHPQLGLAGIREDEAALFDPAERGYYDRLSSMRADADNFRIERVVAGPLRIEQLSAEVLYDGAAVHINRGHLQLLGGEVVGRMIIRPTGEGVHFTMAGDASGIDMSPFLLDHPVADPNDTRVHMSSKASFFLSKDDPIGSLADAKVKMDMTCAGSKVVDTVLAWLDPENKDPMYNWARAVNKKVVGITRPQISSVADRGMYDVTISFPSLGLSKDVRRIPLAPMLRLKFTQDMIGNFAPPGEMLPYLAARGIDADGNFLIPPVPVETE